MKKQRQTVIYHARTRPKKRGPTCIDLFSGAGGFAEGLRQAGWSIISGVDIDKDAGATFRLNFPEASFFEGSISKVTPATLLKDADIKPGELDCLVGGPPCQSFSYNNHHRSASNSRAGLFRHYLRIVRALKPKFLVMENVPGMLTIENGRIIEEIKKSLSKLGYETEVRVLYAEDFGVPQTRRRVFIVASRVAPVHAVFPPGTHGPAQKPSIHTSPLVHRWKASVNTKPLVTVWDAISDLPILRNGKGLQTTLYTKNKESEFQKSVRSNSKILYNHVCPNLSSLMLERISHVPEGGNWTDIPRKLLTPGMRRAHLNCHTKRYGRLAKQGLASTLLTKCDPHWGAYVHPTQNRAISVREAARIQGFPDQFRFAGVVAHKHYVQIGNAVPVPVAKVLAIALKRLLQKSDEYKLAA